MISLDLIYGFAVNHNYLANLIFFLGAYFETLIGVGFFIPGEIFFIPAGILGGLGYINIFSAYLALVIGGILGDTTSYYLGLKFGSIVKKKLFKKNNNYLSENNFNRGISFFKRFGDKSLFLSRFLGPVAWITPFMAGIFKLKYKRFAIYNTLGVSLGVASLIIPAYLFGFAYFSIIKTLGEIFAYLFIIIILLILLMFYLAREKLKAIIKHLIEHGVKYFVSWLIIYILVMLVIFFYVI